MYKLHKCSKDNNNDNDDDHNDNDDDNSHAALFALEVRITGIATAIGFKNILLFLNNYVFKVNAGSMTIIIVYVTSLIFHIYNEIFLFIMFYLRLDYFY